MRLSFASWLALSALALSGCRPKLSEEDRVRAVVRKAVEAANAKKAGEVVADAAPGFVGPSGADVQECRRMLVGYFLGAGWVRAFERSLEVKVDGQKAEAKLEVVLAQGQEVKELKDVVPTAASVLLFTMELELREGDWKFVRAAYRYADH